MKLALPSRDRNSALAFGKVRRRRHHFSRRALLWLVTAICSSLGLPSHAVGEEPPAQDAWRPSPLPTDGMARERAAVEAIKAIGGICGYEIGADRFEHVISIDVPHNSDVDAEVMRRFADLPHVRDLWLTSGAADDDLRYLAGLSRLEELTLHGNLITDAGVAHLGRLKGLRRLDLRAPRITDAGLAHLRNLHNLKSLHLSDSAMSDAGLVHLRGLEDLESLSLDGTRITDAGLVHIARLTNLKGLSLARTAVSSAGLAHLAGLKNLESLDLSGTAVADGDLGPIAGLPKLTRVSLDNTEIGAAVLTGLGGMTQLRSLSLGNSAVADAGLALLSRLVDLKSLGLSDTAITDEGLRHLPVFRGLQTLDLSGTRVSGPGLLQLKDHGAIQTVEVLNTKLSEGLQLPNERPQLPNTKIVGRPRKGIYVVLPAPAQLACFGRRLVAGADPAARPLFGRLAQKQTAADALAAALASAGAERLLRAEKGGAAAAGAERWSWPRLLRADKGGPVAVGDQRWSWHRLRREDEVAGTAFVRTPSGAAAVVLLAPRLMEEKVDREIIPPWDSGDFAFLPRGDRLVAFDTSGRPAWAATRKDACSAMVILDADGDGYVEELVRWNTDYERADRPFLVIHDLTRPGLPAMLAIELYDHKAPKRLRWSFRPGQRPYRDLVIEEKQDGRFRVVTVFPYRPDSRTWDLDAAQPRACWRRLDNPRIKLDFESL